MAQPISIAVEGTADAAVAERLLDLVGLTPGPVFGQSGKNRIDQRIGQYNAAARHAPWLVLRDLNGDAQCPPELVGRLLPVPAARMVFRVVVRAVESWLMADAENLAQFLVIRPAAIPSQPDTEERPKQLLVNLARRSRSPAIVSDMVPAPGTSASVGPAYTSRLIEFAIRHWQPEAALARSDSLARCIAALQRLAETSP